MPYVSRNDRNQIDGLYASLQSGRAEEWLEDDDPEVTAFLRKADPFPPPSPVNLTPLTIRTAAEILGATGV